MNKKFVLDSSVLLYDYEALFKFEENEIIIPSIVLEEINKFKEESSERGYPARRVLEFLEELSKIRPLIKGIQLSEISTDSPLYSYTEGLRTVIRSDYRIYNELISEHFEMDENDYNIIAYALNNNAILVTRDRGMRVIGADFVKVEDYKADMIKEKNFYKGYRKLFIDGKLIEDLFAGKLEDSFLLYPNEFIILINELNPNHCGVGIKKKDKIIPCDFEKINFNRNKLKPLNLEQKMLMYLLMDDDIKCVTATGVSGKSKSIMPIDYALSSVINLIYHEVIIIIS